MEVPVNFDIGNSSGTEPNTSKNTSRVHRRYGLLQINLLYHMAQTQIVNSPWLGLVCSSWRNEPNFLARRNWKGENDTLLSVHAAADQSLSSSLQSCWSLAGGGGGVGATAVCHRREFVKSL